MKPVHCVAFLLPVTMLMVSCSKKEDSNPQPSGGGNNNNPVAPTADFSFTGANVPAPAVVTFTNASANATSYSWSFGDGGMSTSSSPQHTYNSNGTYTVTLTATGAGGTATKSKSVSIKVPTKCKITNLKLTAMPFTNSTGGTWDPTNGPDVYFNITDNIGNVLLNGSAFKVDNVAVGYLPLSWGFSSPFNITPLNTTRKIVIMDYDAPDPDEQIGFGTFNPTTSISGYPSSATLTNGSVTVVLDLDWE